jgi:hypothetical protein
MTKQRMEALSDGVPRIAYGIYVAVPLVWLVPDPRIESRMRSAYSQNSTLPSASP